MAILSQHSNEMTTLHLVKSYCLQHCCMAVKSGTWTTVVCRKSQSHGTTASDVFFHAAREKALNHYSIFATHCQYHSCYTSANCYFGKNCTALNQLFYNHYLVVCIRLLLLLVVYTMCSHRNYLTTQLENLFGILLPFLWTCELTALFLCCFMFFNFCIAVSCCITMSGCRMA